MLLTVSAGFFSRAIIQVSLDHYRIGIQSYIQNRLLWPVGGFCDFDVDAKHFERGNGLGIRWVAKVITLLYRRIKLQEQRLFDAPISKIPCAAVNENIDLNHR